MTMGSQARSNTDAAQTPLDISATVSVQVPPTFSLASPDSFRLIDLPVELRFQVYEYLVVVGKVFYTLDPYAVHTNDQDVDQDKYKIRSLAISRVPRAMYNEVEGVYATSNFSVLPHQFYLYTPFNGNPWCMCSKGLSSEILLRVSSISVWR
jgi:hypothetical protein